MDTVDIAKKHGALVAQDDLPRLILSGDVLMMPSQLEAFREEIAAEERDRLAQELEALGYDAAASVVRATAPIEPEEVFSPHTVVKDM